MLYVPAVLTPFSSQIWTQAVTSAKSAAVQMLLRKQPLTVRSQAHGLKTPL
jgi:hypothetical protein